MTDKINLGKSLPSRVRHGLARSFLRAVSLRQLSKLVEVKLAEVPYFVFESRRLEYFFHSYNNWRLSERTIEVPIVTSVLTGVGGENILEIGNVSRHYYKEFQTVVPRLTVVDRFEVGYGVINEDIRDFESSEPFDFIFSISTFEHMDSDRGRNRDHQEGRSRLVSVAADNIHHVLENLLAPGGTFVLTAPLGYTPEWDATFWSSDITGMPAQEVRRYLMARQDEMTWKQVNPEAGRSARFGAPFPGTNFLSILQFRK